jgi:deoxyribose-phosphate aldolase
MFRGDRGGQRGVVTGHQALLKVIFENDFLEDAHIVRLCELCAERNVAFVKTSTGYGFVKQPNGMYAYKGATDHHLRLMRANYSRRHCDKGGGRYTDAG